jgi:hypothetical protein
LSNPLGDFRNVPIFEKFSDSCAASEAGQRLETDTLKTTYPQERDRLAVIAKIHRRRFRGLMVKLMGGGDLIHHPQSSGSVSQSKDASVLPIARPESERALRI